MANPTFNIQTGTIAKVGPNKLIAMIKFKSADGLRTSPYQLYSVETLDLNEAKKTLSLAAWEWDARQTDISVLPSIPTNTDIQALDQNLL